MTIPSNQQPLLPPNPDHGRSHQNPPNAKPNLGKRYVTNIPEVTVQYRVVSKLINKIFSFFRGLFGYKPLYDDVKTQPIRIDREIPPNASRITSVATTVVIKPNQPFSATVSDDGVLEISAPGPVISQEYNLFLQKPQADSLLQQTSTERTEEIQHFYDACLEDPIYESMAEQDKTFLKEVLIPNLIAAKYALIEKRRENPGTTLVMRELDQNSLMDFNTLVEKAHTSGMLNDNSYFYSKLAIDPSDSVPPRQQVPEDVPARTQMAVKIYPNGKIKFVVPYSRSMGSFKKGSHIIRSNIDGTQFKALVKLSGHRNARDPERIKDEIIMEYRFAKKLNLPLFDEIEMGDRVQLFANPRTPLDSLISYDFESPQPISVKKASEKVEQLFEVALGLLEQISSIDQNGYVHSDIKPGNILIEKRKETDGAEHFIPYITDFGGLTRKGERRTTYTPLYCLPEIRINTRGKDLYALGITFNRLLGLLFNDAENLTSYKFTIEGLSSEDKEKAEEYLRDFTTKFQELCGQMTATSVGEDGKKTYANETLEYSVLIEQFSQLRAEFREKMSKLVPET